MLGHSHCCRLLFEAEMVTGSERSLSTRAESGELQNYIDFRSSLVRLFDSSESQNDQVVPIEANTVQHKHCHSIAEFGL